MNLPCLRCGDVCDECEPQGELSPMKRMEAKIQERKRLEELSDRFWTQYCEYMGFIYGGL